MRWDSSQNTTGCWRMLERGRRYTASKWPDGDVTAQRAADNPCNSYSSGTVIR